MALSLTDICWGMECVSFLLCGRSRQCWETRTGSLSLPVLTVFSPSSSSSWSDSEIRRSLNRPFIWKVDMVLNTRLWQRLKIFWCHPVSPRCVQGCMRGGHLEGVTRNTIIICFTFLTPGPACRNVGERCVSTGTWRVIQGVNTK